MAEARRMTSPHRLSAANAFMTSALRAAELPVEGVDAHAIRRGAVGNSDVKEATIAGLEVVAEPRDALTHGAAAAVELVDEKLDATGAVEAHVVDLAEDQGPAIAVAHAPLETKDLLPVDTEGSEGLSMRDARRCHRDEDGECPASSHRGQAYSQLARLWGLRSGARRAPHDRAAAAPRATPEGRRQVVLGSAPLPPTRDWLDYVVA